VHFTHTFDSLRRLLDFYRENSLPNRCTKLCKPYGELVCTLNQSWDNLSTRPHAGLSGMPTVSQWWTCNLRLVHGTRTELNYNKSTQWHDTFIVIEHPPLGLWLASWRPVWSDLQGRIKYPLGPTHFTMPGPHPAGKGPYARAYRAYRLMRPCRPDICPEASERRRRSPPQCWNHGGESIFSPPQYFPTFLHAVPYAHDAAGGN